MMLEFVVVGLLAGVMSAVAGLWLRWHAWQKEFAARRRLRVLPSPMFDPSLDEIATAAKGVLRLRRRWLARDASGARIVLCNEGERFFYEIEVPERDVQAVRRALYGARCQVVLLPDTAIEAREKLTVTGRSVRRAEIALAREDRWSLKRLPLDPDPLYHFAKAAEGLGKGERLEVCIDILPPTRGQLRRFHGHASGGASRAERFFDVLASGLERTLDGLVDAFDNSSSSQTKKVETGSDSAGQRAGRNIEYKEIREKLVDARDGLACTQVLVCAFSGSDARSTEVIADACACFEQFRESNYFRRLGRYLVGSWFVGGADSWLHRRWFDYRWRTGLHRPRKQALLTVRELAGFWKPPTAHLRELENVERGINAPPPRKLPLYTGQKNLTPLGFVYDEEGNRCVAATPRDETFFEFIVGQTRKGKSYIASVRAADNFFKGYGGMIIDPPGTAISKLKPLLTRSEIADRVLAIDVTEQPLDAHHASWNPINMTGRRPEEIPGRARTLVDGFMAASWGDRATRTSSILNDAIQCLMHLALKLPDECAPTIYQIKTLLDDPDWREAIAPHLPLPQQRWLEREVTESNAADFGPTKRLISNLSTNEIRAFLGSPTSTYDARTAMDNNQIVLMTTGGNLVSALLFFDLVKAAHSRMDVVRKGIEPDLFYVTVDELPALVGHIGNEIETMLTQLAKFGIRLCGIAQEPHQLTKETRNAFFNNRSLFITTILGGSTPAKMVAEEFAGQIPHEELQAIPRYNYIAQCDLNGERTKPFAIQGIDLTKAWASRYRKDKLAELEETLSFKKVLRSSGVYERTEERLPTIEETLKIVETHDQRILENLGVGSHRSLGPNVPVTTTGIDRPHQRRKLPLRTVYED